MASSNSPMIRRSRASDEAFDPSSSAARRTPSRS